MRKGFVITVGTLIASLLTACSPARLLGATQSAAPGGELHGVAYASGPRHAMDVYVPAKGATPAPVVVFFYGGGWTSGNRASYEFVGRSLAACGLLTFIPDYRVWPETGFPGFLRDGAEAVAAARREAPNLGGDPSHLFLIGHSAGAYIAVMLALDPEYLAGAGVEPHSAPAGVVGISGPYDFLPLRDPVLEQIFAPVGPRTQPITFAANAPAPMLLLTGGDDRTVDPGNTTRLATRVRETGGNVKTVVYPGRGHVTMAAALAPALSFLAPVRADVCRFVDQHAGILSASVAAPPVHVTAVSNSNPSGTNQTGTTQTGANTPGVGALPGAVAR
jgi:acetyl esterase/lipase